MTAETNRKIQNIIRFGIIAEVDYQKALARVQTGDNITDWIPWATVRTGTSQTWTPPTVGEQVILGSHNGELSTAAIIGYLYSANQPSQDESEHCFLFADGAKLAYNQASGVLTATGIKTATIQASEQITLDTPLTIITGNAQIKGNLDVTGNIGSTGSGGIKAKNNIQSTGGDIKANGDVIAGSISLLNHKHLEQGDNKLTSEAK